jgi:cytochrome c-type biogenesis protein CcsB
MNPETGVLVANLGGYANLETGLFVVSLIGYIIAFLLHSLSAALGKQELYRFGRIAAWLGAVLAMIGLGIRWYTAGHPPLSNMYESLVTFGTFFVWIALLFTRNEPFPLIEAGTSVIAILLTGAASVFSSDVKPLIPALNSYWLHLHVSIAFLGEACFALSFLLSYFFCARRLIEGGHEENDEKKLIELPWGEKFACLMVVFGVPLGFITTMILVLLKNWNQEDSRWQPLLGWVVIPATVASVLFFLALFLLRGAMGKTADRWLPPIERLDELNYRAIALGYPLFTVGGIIFGMVWANKAWGRYWGWDPKETWAFITFLVYSVFLHLRLTKGWRGTHTAVLSVIGFGVTLFTLFGVNLLLSGLHAYASW